MTQMLKSIEEQARELALANKEAQPYIQKIFWFPAKDEIRLVEVEDDIPTSSSKFVEPFYFGPSPAYGLFAPSAIALVRSEEVGKLKLPKRWGTWAAGQLILGE